MESSIVNDLPLAAEAHVPGPRDFLWIFLVAHAFVWLPNLVIDRLFCHGKMMRHMPSLILIEAVSLVFFVAKTVQIQRPKVLRDRFAPPSAPVK